MENYEKRSTYEDVNREIQSMLAVREKSGVNKQDHYVEHQQDILPILDSLLRTYTEINMALKADSSQALKDVVLNSDIKMSMVCETLLETLKRTTEDKNRLTKENYDLNKIRMDSETREAAYKIQINKLETEAEFKRRNVEELNRIIKDQKDKMNEFRIDSQKARNEVQFFKAKISEIENLRGKGNERLAVYEKEIEALGKIIKDKEEENVRLQKEKREEEQKNGSIKTKIVEMESFIDILNKKNEALDKNLSLCNSELSKLLCENKKAKSEHDKYKESSYYYEGLYNSLNSQNAYLNAELSKLLKKNEYVNDIDGFIEKYKKKNKKLRKKYLKLKDKQSQEEKRSESIQADETSDLLVRKIEDLESKNRDYRNKLDKLEDEKKAIESRIRSLDLRKGVPNVQRLHEYKPTSTTRNIDTTEKKPSNFRTLTSNYRPSVIQPVKHERIAPANSQLFNNYNMELNNNRFDKPDYVDRSNKDYLFEKDNKSKFDLNNNMYYLNRDYFNRSLFQDRIDREDVRDNDGNKTYLKLFNLENSYEDKNQFDLPGGFQESLIPEERKEIITPSAPPKLNFEYGNKEEMKTVSNKRTELVGDIKAEDENSVESIKTYHTSSTLKEMMARTENLQKKFETLEEKLDNIKEGDAVDKLADKIKTYNSYYSDWNPDSNESDYI